MNELDDFLCPVYEQDVKENIDEETQKKHGLFDYINDITNNKENLLYSEYENTGSFPKEFSSYMTIKSLGNYVDTIMFANEMNKYFDIPPEIQYLFYLYGIPKKKRFAKFYSPDMEREEKIKTLSRFFNWGYREACSNLKMFSNEDIDEMKRRMNNERTEKTKRTRK